MRATVRASDIQGGLALVRAIKSEHVRLEAAAAAVTLTATSKTMGEIQATVPASVDEIGEVGVVSFARFDGIVTTFPQATKVQVTTKPSTVEIAGRNSLCRIPSLPPHEMPPVFKIDGMVMGTIELSGSDVEELLATAVAANRDERTRRSLCGVCLSTTVGDATAFTATNGLFLSTINVPGKFLPEGDRSCIVPLSAIAVLRSLTSRIKIETLRVQRSRALIIFETTAFRFSSLLVDGVFPACEHLIPKNADNRIFIDRSALIASLQRMQAASTTPIPLVTLAWNDGGETVNLSLTELEQLEVGFPVSTGSGVSRIKSLGWANG
jgi:DNA polymerase III sliding clamp (beta) subunit (PCNA family)